MKEQWILQSKSAGHREIAKELGISPLVVMCMMNRDIKTVDEMKRYMKATTHELYDPFLMKNMSRAVRLILQGKERGERIAIASDFDCDGIFSGYVLKKGFERLGIDSKIYTPDRVAEGYGLNERIVDEAVQDGYRILVTCDNGIAANEAVAYAKEQGMTVIVTDHHEPQEELPVADTILDPKQDGETYPFHGLCGCGVAFKLICALYEKAEIEADAIREFLEYVAIATVADVMELRDENRILVKYGLKALQNTRNIGLRQLIEAQGMVDKEIRVGHIGFTIGPCFNAAGRISNVEKSFDLLFEENVSQAKERAIELKEINDQRKSMTEKGATEAMCLVQEWEQKGELPKVFVIFLPDVHESLAGIIAGRVKESYHHPTIVFTRTEEGLVKGSGRSIEAYHMFDELMKCKDLMVHFGGHKMAAGMTLLEENLSELMSRLNEQCALEEKDFCKVIKIDAAMPIGYISPRLIEQFEIMEPFGNGNPGLLFAEQHFRILRGRRLGKEKNVLKLQVQNEKGAVCDAMLFRGVDEFEEFILREWGETELARMYDGRENDLDVAFTYVP
ncbi:MAG: single-stranded-DNA-specific exonuclease RecJ, partial [Eubacterium sp.]|nr:single-stranded-DNA-specific exonuclease RecJ [Eubacterium sp.]